MGFNLEFKGLKFVISHRGCQ